MRVADPAGGLEVVGREEELAVIERRPRSLVIEGEAGIGKTTLWAHGVAVAQQELAWVLSTRPTEAETAFAYAGLTDLLDPVLTEVLPQLPQPQRQALEVALLRAEGRADPHAVSVAVLSVLRMLAAVAPVLIAIDDVQWLDSSTARALEFSLRRLVAEPVRILVSGRTEPSRFGLEDAEVLSVGPLAANAIAQLIRRRLGRSLARPTLMRLHRACGGNPFFALEIARALDDSGGTGDLPLPENLRDLVQSRLARLPRDVREALLYASALSQPTLTTIEAAGGAAKLHGLVKAEAADVISLEGDRIRFTHPLLSAALYAELPPGERRRLHGRLAAVVTDPEERARHLARAATGADEQVAGALDLAARSARARGAPDAAAELAELAWQLTPASAAEAIQRRKIDAAEHLLDGGDPSRARRLLEEAVAALPEGPLRARAFVRLGLVFSYGFDEGEKGAQLMEKACAEAGADLPLRAGAERDLGHLLTASLRPAEAEPHIRAALELAEQLGDRILLAETLGVLAYADFQRGRGISWPTIDRAVELTTPDEHSRVLRHPSWLTQMIAFWAQDSFGRDWVETLRRSAFERGEEGQVAWCLNRFANIETAAGNWDAALAYSREAQALATETGHEAVRARGRFIELTIAAHRGDLRQARARAQKTHGPGNAHGRLSVAALLGFVELSAGNAARACDHLDALAEGMRDGGVEEPTILGFRGNLIEARIALGRLEEARGELEWLEERGRALDRPWALAVGGRCRALLLAAERDLEGALDAAVQALRDHERLPVPFERARTLLVKGTIERRAKQKRAARESLNEALRIFEELGAAVWAQKARDELARIGGRAGSDGLTPTERQIAELVRAGSTNREVAEAMFISVKTVEANLSRIYRKLGVASRRELARARAWQT